MPIPSDWADHGVDVVVGWLEQNCVQVPIPFDWSEQQVVVVGSLVLESIASARWHWDLKLKNQELGLEL